MHLRAMDRCPYKNSYNKPLNKKGKDYSKWHNLITLGEAMVIYNWIMKNQFLLYVSFDIKLANHAYSLLPMKHVYDLSKFRCIFVKI
jgi:hypothetical protein